MNSRNTLPFGFRLVSICSVLLLLISSFSPVQAEPNFSAPWRDEFDGPTLDPVWNWTNENPDLWSLQDGFLNLTVSTLAVGSENLLLRPVEAGDFTIETRLLFEPETNFQIAGLVLYQDASNYLVFGRAFCDNPDGCVGNGIYFDKIQDGNWTDGNFATPVINPEEAYLRLERRGEMVRGLFSVDGASWFEIGTHAIPPGFQANGVGLTTAQDFNTPDEDVIASFDYFELSEGWGFLPEGYHDYDQGDVPDWACNAGGWAVDPDDRSARLNVAVVVDRQTVATVVADEFRQDLLDNGLCPDGNCGFFAALWDLISAYEPHRVNTWAQDSTSGEWFRLSNSQKQLTCRTQDIYTYNPRTQQTVQVTDMRDTNEWNPAWSPDGRQIAYDVTAGDDYHAIYITNLDAGVSGPLAGAGGGNDAAWSPDGRWIAFDRWPAGDFNIYLLPAGGGVRTLLVGDAVSAAWSPRGTHLAFTRQSEGSLWVVELVSGQETLVAANGLFPAWSPNGNWIAYQADDDIWKVAVNQQGELQGDPVRLTGSPGLDAQPTWSADSKTIVYSAGLSRDQDLWAIPALGGLPTWLAGGREFGDYDPAFSTAGSFVAYDSFTPEAQAARDWLTTYTYDLPPGYWDEGTHTYHFEFDGESTDELSFDSSSAEPFYSDFVLLRGAVLRGRVNGGCSDINAIHPDQQTRFHIGFVSGLDRTYSEAVADNNDFIVKVTWDGREPVDLIRNQIVPRSADMDVWSYFCSFTYPANNTTVATGNLQVTWSPTNPEEITGLRWKGSENLTNAWAHPNCQGDLEYFGNSWVNEHENEAESSFFASLVGWGTAGTWQHRGRAVDIKSQSLGCPGSIEIPVDTDYKLFEGSMKVNLIGVQRTFEFGATPFDHAVRPFIPRLHPYDGFSEVIHPDASGLKLVRETAADCGYGCRVNDWNGTWFAIHNPDTGLGMIVMHTPSSIPVALWVDVDDGSFTNASSVLLLPPEGGFTGSVVETEYLFFYDSHEWAPSLSLPAALMGANLSMDDLGFLVFLPLTRH